MRTLLVDKNMSQYIIMQKTNLWNVEVFVKYSIKERNKMVYLHQLPTNYMS